MGEKLLIATGNALKNSDIDRFASGGGAISENPSLPFRNSYNDDPTKPYFSETDSFNFVLDLENVEARPKRVWFHKTNAREETIAKISENNVDSGWGSPVQSTTINFDIYAQGGGTSPYVDSIERTVCGLLLDDPTSRYLRIDMEDIGHPDGRLEVGIIHVGDVFEIQNVDFGEKKSYTDKSTLFSGVNTPTYAKPKKIRRVFTGRMSFVDLQSTQAARKIVNMGVGFHTFIGRNPYYVDESFDEQSSEEWIYGRFTKIDFKEEVYNNGQEEEKCVRYTLDFQFDEVEYKEIPLVQNYTDWNDFIKLSHRTDSVLVVLAPKEPKDPYNNPLVWENVSGNHWKTDYPINTEENWSVWAVIQQGIELSVLATAADCDTDEGWFFDINSAREIHVHLIGGLDPNDPDSLVQICPILSFATMAPALKMWGPIFDLSEIKTGIIANDTLFELRLTENGLTNIKSSLDSPYFGVSIPSIKSTVIIMDTTYFTYVDRFDWTGEAVVLHGDGGTVLSLAEHYKIDTFKMAGALADEENMHLTIEFDNSSSALNRLIPNDIVANQDGVKLAYKPYMYGGPIESLPMYRQSGKNYLYLGQESFLSAIWDSTENKNVETSDYAVISEPDESSVQFEVAPKQDATFTARATASVDYDGVWFDGEQLAGAMLYHLMWFHGKEKLDALPLDTFEDFDTANPTYIKKYIDGTNQVTVLNIVQEWTRSTFTRFRKRNGTWNISKYDPDNIPASVATVSDDEIFWIKKSDIQRNSVYDITRVFYAKDIALNSEGKFVWEKHPTASKVYQTAESIDMSPTMLYRETDARKILRPYTAINGQINPRIEMACTGEIFNAIAGDVITVNKLRAFDIEGTWESKQFIIKEIDYKLMDDVGTAIVVMEEPITYDQFNVNDNISFGNISTFSAENIGTSDSCSGLHDVDVATDILFGIVGIRSDDADNNAVVTELKYNGVNMTLIDQTDSPLNSKVKLAFFQMSGAPTGIHTATAKVDLSCTVVGVVMIDLIGVATIHNFGFARNLNSTSINKNITSLLGDLILAAHIMHKAPLNSSLTHNGDDTLADLRIDSAGSFVSTNAARIKVFIKNALASQTLVSVNDEVNRGVTQVLAGVALRS